MEIRDLDYLRNLRKSKHMSLSYVGKIMGKHKATVRRWERGQIQISLAQWLKLMDIYEVNNNNLKFTGNEEK